MKFKWTNSAAGTRLTSSVIIFLIPLSTTIRIGNRMMHIDKIQSSWVATHRQHKRFYISTNLFPHEVQHLRQNIAHPSNLRLFWRRSGWIHRRRYLLYFVRNPRNQHYRSSNFHWCFFRLLSNFPYVMKRRTSTSIIISHTTSCWCRASGVAREVQQLWDSRSAIGRLERRGGKYKNGSHLEFVVEY